MKRSSVLSSKKTRHITKAKSFEELSRVLKTLLARSEEGKRHLEEKIHANVKELIFPYKAKLRNTGLTMELLTYLEIIKTTVQNVFFFFQKVTSRQYGFTPREIQVARLIREGKTT